MTDEIDNQQEIEERVKSPSHGDSGAQSTRTTEPVPEPNAGSKTAAYPKVSGAKQISETDVTIASVPPMALPLVNPNGGATVGTSPILQEMNNLQPEPGQVNEKVFEEVPVKVCGQLYKSTLEVGFALSKKGMPMRELPEARVNTQAEIIYGILKKNQISIKYLDVFMLGAGMMGDWKFMGTLAAEQKQENKVRGKPKVNEKLDYGEIA